MWPVERQVSTEGETWVRIKIGLVAIQGSMIVNDAHLMHTDNIVS
jgi:hypothetical protein